MTGASRRSIEKVLFEEFYDGSEFIGSSFSREVLMTLIKEQIPNVNWDDVYQIIISWRSAYNNLYDGIYNENKLLLEAGITDTRDICKRKYQNGLMLFANEKKVPLYYDRDIKEWRVPTTLEIYEEIIGDKVLQYHRLRNESLTKLAKRGGKLLSGVETRQIIFDLFEETKKLENKEQEKKENKK